jgi:hypothetical protein
MNNKMLHCNLCIIGELHKKLVSLKANINQ